jgi:hypothetical protein
VVLTNGTAFPDSTGRYELRWDANPYAQLAFVDKAAGSVLWSTVVQTAVKEPARLTLTASGNMQLSDAYGNVFWSAGSGGVGLKPYCLYIVEGSLVLLDSVNGTTWLAPTVCPGGPDLRIKLGEWDQCGGMQCSMVNVVKKLPCQDAPLPYSCCPTGWQCQRASAAVWQCMPARGLDMCPGVDIWKAGASCGGTAKCGYDGICGGACCGFDTVCHRFSPDNRTCVALPPFKEPIGVDPGNYSYLAGQRPPPEPLVLRYAKQRDQPPPPPAPPSPRRPPPPPRLFVAPAPMKAPLPPLPRASQPSPAKGSTAATAAAASRPPASRPPPPGRPLPAASPPPSPARKPLQVIPPPRPAPAPPPSPSPPRLRKRPAPAPPSPSPPARKVVAQVSRQPPPAPPSPRPPSPRPPSLRPPPPMALKAPLRQPPPQPPPPQAAPKRAPPPAARAAATQGSVAKPPPQPPPSRLRSRAPPPARQPPPGSSKQQPSSRTPPPAQQQPAAKTQAGSRTLGAA